MLGDGGSQKEALRPDFNRSILVDFQGAKISSDTGFLLLREMDERFDIIGPMCDCLEDRRSAVHTRHSLVQMIRQRVYQIAAGYEDCNDADYLRIDPAFALPSARATRRERASPCCLGWRTRSWATRPGSRCWTARFGARSTPC